MYNWLHRVWYEGAPSYRLLLPLSGIYWLLITLRQYLYQARLPSQSGWFASYLRGAFLPES